MGDKTNLRNSKILRCKDWLENQNSKHDLAQHNKNDIEFIIRTNAERKQFLLSSVDEETTVPDGVENFGLEPKKVPLHRLRVDDLHMECAWQFCKWHTDDYTLYRKHVKNHLSQLHITKNKNSVTYICLWDICGFKTDTWVAMVCHVNYHAYHGRLLAIGYNARATLDLLSCKKDSTRRNQLPQLNWPHTCLWLDCDEKFSSIQTFFDHVKCHVKYSDKMCSWAGCGATAPRMVTLMAHVRSHTGERLVACYHCGAHFANNRRLADHLRRQNASEAGFACGVCGASCGSEALRAEHARRHVCVAACALCDMTAPTRAALAAHVRYRHAPRRAAPYACTRCTHRCVSKSDLRRHIETHKKKIKLSTSDPEDSCDSEPKKRKREPRKYACHICPGSKVVFSRGNLLTSHLFKKHGAQWPSGHSRFRYQAGEDGVYRLTMTRYEILEVSRKIVNGDGGTTESLDNSYEFEINKVSEPTESTPVHYEITVRKDGSNEEGSIPDDELYVKNDPVNTVEITMCDVDQFGNVIKSETIQSFVKT